MEKISTFVSQIKFHSKIHLAISLLGLILCAILIGIEFVHYPSLITLLITSTASFTSGTVGLKMQLSPSKRQVLLYFILQVFVLSS